MEKSDSNLEYLKIYFDETNWKKFSDDEKQKFANIKKNYESLLAIGKIGNIFY